VIFTTKSVSFSHSTCAAKDRLTLNSFSVLLLLVPMNIQCQLIKAEGGEEVVEGEVEVEVPCNASD
jgi:hypothetical protein